MRTTIRISISVALVAAVTTATGAATGASADASYPVVDAGLTATYDDPGVIAAPGVGVGFCEA